MLLAFLVLGEKITLLKGASMVLTAAGTYLMLDRKKSITKAESKAWLIYALLSAVFAALTSILGKIGIEGVESNLGTAIRTAVVLAAAWAIVFFKEKLNKKTAGGLALLTLGTALLLI